MNLKDLSPGEMKIMKFLAKRVKHIFGLVMKEGRGMYEPIGTKELVINEVIKEFYGN